MLENKRFSYILYPVFLLRKPIMGREKKDGETVGSGQGREKRGRGEGRETEG